MIEINGTRVTKQTFEKLALYELREVLKWLMDIEAERYQIQLKTKQEKLQNNF